MTAKKKGRPPVKKAEPISAINIRIAESMVDRLDEISKLENRSRSKQIETILKEFIDRYEEN